MSVMSPIYFYTVINFVIVTAAILCRGQNGEEITKKATTCIDRVLRDLDILQNNLNKSNSFNPIFSDAIRRMNFLNTFIVCNRIWSRSRKIPIYSLWGLDADLLTEIVDALWKFGEDIHTLSVRSEGESFSNLVCVSDQLVLHFKRKIGRFHERIIAAYGRQSSSQWHSCITGAELVEVIDLVRQNLVDLLLVRKKSYCAALRAQIQDLEEKLTFFQGFIPFAHWGTTHIEEVAWKAARLSYMCSFLDEVDEEHSFVHQDVETCPFHDEVESEYIGQFCSMICKQLEKINPVDIQAGEIYINALRASNSSASLHTMKMDEHILNNFNDSLIICLWKLLCCSSSPLGFLNNELQILFKGLRFMRSILRMPMEEKNELNEKIGAGRRFLRRKPEEKKNEFNERFRALLSEAGIIICALSLSRVKEGDANSLDTTKVRGCNYMLVNINKRIKHIRDQASVSSGGWLPFYHSFKTQQCCKPFSYKLSKTEVPITHEVMVGRDDEAKKVSDRLIGGPEQLEIVPIVGMPGLGKTTLAKRVYNDSSIIYHFHIRLWCTVSRGYELKGLLLQILLSDGKHPGINEELKNLHEHELLQKLYQKLKGKMYLVVFDDVWDMRIWNDLRHSFPDEKKGSRILITSRFSNVASQIEYGGEPLNLRLLTERESLQLLQKKVFGEEDCPQSLYGPSVEIAKFCKRLPLALVVIAGVVASIEQDVLAWEEFARSLTSTMVSGTDACKKSLELSYENLPCHLKNCLLYFAAFGEDAKIVTRNLMRLWVAEGFVENSDGKKLEKVAEEYMMDLIGRNLVMVSECSSMGGVKSCCIHDLLLEFCKSKAKEKNFLQVLRGYDELSTFTEPCYPYLPRLSICSSVEDFHKSKLFCPHLGSLLFFRQNAGDDFPFADVPFLFCMYKRLTILNLEHIVLMQKELPTEVELLCRLRYLALRADAMWFIPPSISNLSSLETFYLQSLLEVSLPHTIWDMKRLRHVRVGGHLGTCVLPSDNVLENPSTLPDLDTLCYLRLPFNEDGENIMRRIPNIHQLKIVIADTGKEVCCDMSRLDSLDSLNIVLSHFQGPSNHLSSLSQEIILSSLSPRI